MSSEPDSKQGRHAKVAITVIMRKLIILANAFLRDDRTWSPKTLAHNGYSSRLSGCGTLIFRAGLLCRHVEVRAFQP